MASGQQDNHHDASRSVLRVESVAVLAAAAMFLRPDLAAAVDGPAVGPTDYVTPRYEPAGFPILGGNTDTGFMFGAAGTLTRFSGDARPYRWNMDLVLSASVKGGPSGLEITEYNLQWAWDVVGLFGGRLRLNPSASLVHVINNGYYGQGDMSSAVLPANAVVAQGRYFESMMTEGRARVIGRWTLFGPLSIALVGGYRYDAPTTYAGSLLALQGAASGEAGQPRIFGLGALSMLEIGAGIVVDTRDSEVMPTRGLYLQASARVVEGITSGSGVGYTEVAASISGYHTVAGPVIFAGRLVTDVEIGNVPFYDLYAGGPFNPEYMPGGASGVRGVPFGRYAGPVKFVANFELRSWLGSFSFVGQHFRLGADVFFDTGRVWGDLNLNAPATGTSLGLKFGVGAGLFLLWGQAAIFRIEAAYSPDAVSENPGFPIGIYVEDGVMF